MHLKNKKILITGGSLGIGLATARVLVEAGAQVGVTGRNAARLQKAAAATGAHAIVADVSQPADVERTMVEFLKQFDGLDCLINNAGIGVHKPLVELSAQEMEEVWRVNVLGATLMAQKAAGIFIQQQHGNIVNIASTSGLRGYETGTAYVASKFALRGMTECWRAELRRHNVRVMLINPSEVPTAFGNADRVERPEQDNKLTSVEIAYSIKAALEMDDRGFIPELSVFATNPF
jgi:3-oxoacyl-[acyl-carrier protein] reductase